MSKKIITGYPANMGHNMRVLAAGTGKIVTRPVLSHVSKNEMKRRLSLVDNKGKDFTKVTRDQYSIASKLGTWRLKKALKNPTPGNILGIASNRYSTFGVINQILTQPCPINASNVHHFGEKITYDLVWFYSNAREEALMHDNASFEDILNHALNNFTHIHADLDLPCCNKVDGIAQAVIFHNHKEQLQEWFANLYSQETKDLPIDWIFNSLGWDFPVAELRWPFWEEEYL